MFTKFYNKPGFSCVLDSKLKGTVRIFQEYFPCNTQNQLDVESLEQILLEAAERNTILSGAEINDTRS